MQMEGAGIQWVVRSNVKKTKAVKGQVLYAPFVVIGLNMHNRRYSESWLSSTGEGGGCGARAQWLGAAEGPLDAGGARAVGSRTDPCEGGSPAHVGTTRQSRGGRKLTEKPTKLKGGATVLSWCRLKEASNGKMDVDNGLRRSNTCGICGLFEVQVGLGGSHRKTGMVYQ
ncbi:hypothetical protein CRG98_001479 [Punica granatum]|uniref:Uncharacterized protein n=1 Tax=Punica granatum TaxID=22663 RepID=A0A2I0LBW0_PUNGR|nr:hypothetical protein CRG98_001479 [Punica granatum]